MFGSCCLYVRFKFGLTLLHRWFTLGVLYVNVLVYCWFMHCLFWVYFGLYAIGFNFWSFGLCYIHVRFMFGLWLVYAGFMFGSNVVHDGFVVGPYFVYVWLHVG